MKSRNLVALLCSVAAASAPVVAEGRAAPPDPGAFRISGVERLEGHRVKWVATGGGVVAAGSAREMTVSLANRPETVVSRLRFDEPVAAGILLGRHAFLGTEKGELRVVDLTDPFSPVDLGDAGPGLRPAPRGAVRLATLGDLLIVAETGYGLRVVSAPRLLHRLPGALHTGHGKDHAVFSGPVEIGRLELSGTIEDVAAAGGRAYVAFAEGRIDIVDLADPSRPEPAGEIAFDGPVRSVAVTGGRLIVLFASGILESRDAAFPERRTGRAELPFRADGLVASGRTLYATAADGGLRRLTVAGGTDALFTVDVGNIFFNPSALDIAPGDTVQWNWVGGSHSTTSGSCPATVCSSDGKWDSGVQTSGSFSHQFDSPGVNPYYCTVHLAAMQGTVSVFEGDPAPVITQVKKKGGPFKLKISGRNFDADCTILIDGQPVPRSKCKSATRVVAKKGKALKAMVPKGVEVLVTVVNNDDGSTSEPFPFTR